MRRVKAGTSARGFRKRCRARVFRGSRGRRTRWLPGAVLLGALLSGACSQVQESTTASAVAAATAEAQSGSSVLVQTGRNAAVQKPRAFILPGVETALPSPARLEEGSWRQLVTFGHEGEEQTLLALLEVHDGALNLAVLQPAGIRLFSGIYRDGEIYLEKTTASGKVPPVNQIFLDILLSLCPPGEWELPEGFVLEDSAEDVRQLVDPDGRIVYKIEYGLRQGRRMPLCIEQQIFAYRIVFEYLD